VEIVGMPKCRLPLAQAATYLATAPKSNASTSKTNGVGSGKDKMPLRLPPHLFSLANPAGGAGLAKLPPDLKQTLLTGLCPAA
jgi:replication-associated recombination protein RarA